jgi:hypothetical protein
MVTRKALRSDNVSIECTSESYIHDEIKSKLNVRNISYCLVQSIFSLLSISLRIIYETISFYSLFHMV